MTTEECNNKRQRALSSLIREKQQNRREIITTKHEELDEDKLFTSLKDVKKYIDELIKKYGEDAYILQEWSGYEDNYFVLYSRHEETDKEFNKRYAKKEKAINEEYDAKLREIGRQKALLELKIKRLQEMRDNM